MKVQSEIKIRMVAGNYVDFTNKVEDLFIANISSNDQLVNIQWGVVDISVLKKDLLKAIENATDNP